jgi:NADH-quinone oxidoreductase subunit J
MTLNTIFFYLVAAVTVLSAIGVVVSQNIVRAATWLLFALVGTACVYFMLGADFVGATQVLVYVGGTLVLVVFGVMLTAQGPFITMKTGAVEWVVSVGVGLLLYGVLALSLSTVQSPGPARDKLSPSVNLGQALLGFDEPTPEAKVTGTAKDVQRPRKKISYLLPFEIVSVHLLVVLVGAAYLARAKRRAGVWGLGSGVRQDGPLTG